MAPDTVSWNCSTPPPGDHVKRFSTSLAIALALLMTFATSAVAAQPTTTTVNGAMPSDGTLGTYVFVLDGRGKAITQGVVVAKMFHLRSGKWVLIDSDRDRPSSDGAFEHRLENVPSRGRCKLVAKFLGTDRYAPSKDVKRPHCTDPYWHAY